MLAREQYREVDWLKSTSSRIHSRTISFSPRQTVARDLKLTKPSGCHIAPMDYSASHWRQSVCAALQGTAYRHAYGRAFAQTVFEGF